MIPPVQAAPRLIEVSLDPSMVPSGSIVRVKATVTTIEDEPSHGPDLTLEVLSDDGDSIYSASLKSDSAEESSYVHPIKLSSRFKPATYRIVVSSRSEGVESAYTYLHVLKSDGFDKIELLRQAITLHKEAEKARSDADLWTSSTKLRQAAELYEKVGSFGSAANAEEQLAKVYSECNQYSEARRHLQTAIRLSRRLKDFGSRKRAEEALSEIDTVARSAATPTGAVFLDSAFLADVLFQFQNGHRTANRQKAARLALESIPRSQVLLASPRTVLDLVLAAVAIRYERSRTPSELSWEQLQQGKQDAIVRSSLSTVHKSLDVLLAQVSWEGRPLSGLFDRLLEILATSDLQVATAFGLAEAAYAGAQLFCTANPALLDVKLPKSLESKIRIIQIKRGQTGDLLRFSKKRTAWDYQAMAMLLNPSAADELRVLYSLEGAGQRLATHLAAIKLLTSIARRLYESMSSITGPASLRLVPPDVIEQIRRKAKNKPWDKLKGKERTEIIRWAIPQLAELFSYGAIDLPGIRLPKLIVRLLDIMNRTALALPAAFALAEAISIEADAVYTTNSTIADADKELPQARKTKVFDAGKLDLGKRKNQIVARDVELPDSLLVPTALGDSWSKLSVHDSDNG